jgi:hypothetical protein
LKGLASQGKLVSTVEQVLLFCYRYDAHQGKYVVVANRVMQVGAAAIALMLGGFLGLFWHRDRRTHRRAAAAASEGDRVDASAVVGEAALSDCRRAKEPRDNPAPGRRQK